MVKSKSNNVTAAMYDTLVRPVITEKSMVSSEAGKVVFEVPLSAVVLGLRYFFIISYPARESSI